MRKTLFFIFDSGLFGRWFRDLRLWVRGSLVRGADGLLKLSHGKIFSQGLKSFNRDFQDGQDGKEWGADSGMGMKSGGMGRGRARQIACIVLENANG
jgi:hypothetical protein